MMSSAFILRIVRPLAVGFLALAGSLAMAPPSSPNSVASLVPSLATAGGPSGHSTFCIAAMRRLSLASLALGPLLRGLGRLLPAMFLASQASHLPLAASVPPTRRALLVSPPLCLRLAARRFPRALGAAAVVSSLVPLALPRVTSPPEVFLRRPSLARPFRKRMAAMAAMTLLQSSARTGRALPWRVPAPLVLRAIRLRYSGL